MARKDERGESLTIGRFKGRLRPAEIGWLAVATTALALFFGQIVAASADDSNVGIDKFAFTPAALI